jgi:hypothetical protein
LRYLLALSSNHIFSGTLTAVNFIDIDIIYVSEESLGRIRFIFGDPNPKVFDWHNTIFLPHPCVINDKSIYNGGGMLPVSVNGKFVVPFLLYLSYLEMRY